MVGVVAAVAITFAIAAIIMIRVLPNARSGIDYLVIGTVATFASLMVLFLLLSRAVARGSGLFFRRRKG